MNNFNARLDVSKEVVQSLPNTSSYVFGGYVRDYIANEEFKDMDIVVNGNFAKTDFFNSLKSKGFQITYVGDGHYNKGFKHEVYSFKKSGYQFQVDLLTGTGGSPVPSGKWDADINQVYMQQDLNPRTGFGCASNIDLIKEKIKKKEYKRLSGMSHSREAKLKERGYCEAGTIRPETNNVTVSIGKAVAVKMEEKMVEKKMVDQKSVAVDAKPSVIEMMKKNANEAAYRIAATQMTNGTRAAILTVMEKQGHNSERIKAVTDLLDTEGGAAIISMLLSAGLMYAPVISEDPRAQRLATEFQISGMTIAGNAVIGIAMEHFAPVIMNALAALPPIEAASKVRVTDDRPKATEALVEATESEEEAESKPLAKAAAR